MIFNNLASIKRQTIDCGDTVVQLSAYSDCDIVGNTNFGSGDFISGSSGITAPFKFKLKTTIKATVKALPRKIQRVVSDTCRPQKTSTNDLYQIEGLSIFPLWKKDEIERMFLQKTVVIDGFSIPDERSDALFVSIPQVCEDVFLLRATLTDCTEETIFSCEDRFRCGGSIGTGFVIMDGNPNGFFGDNGVIVAKDVPSLINWLKIQPDVLQVDTVSDADLATMPCMPYAVIKVLYSSRANKISSIYTNSPIPSNRIYAQTLNDYNAPYLNALCGGVDRTQCNAPTLTTISYNEEICTSPTLIDISYNFIGSGCPIIMSDKWYIDGSTIISQNTDGQRTIQIGVSSDEYVLPPAIGQMNGTHTIDSGEESGFNTGLSSMIINSVKVNGNYINGDQFTYNQDTSVLSIDAGFSIGDEVEYFYASGAALPVYFSRELLFIINGDGCVPTVPLMVRSAADGGTVSNMVSGAYIEIMPNGEVRYTGFPNWATPEKTHIGQFGFIYAI